MDFARAHMSWTSEWTELHFIQRRAEAWWYGLHFHRLVLSN
uniref:Uncharacterized protein n=1 Tax=Heterorhabditis bacteriophora TaxID=37862 RepID=A0A1I7X6I7_HETBA